MHLKLDTNTQRLLAERDAIIAELRRYLRFMVDAAKTEAGMSIYKAHIEQAERTLSHEPR